MTDRDVIRQVILSWRHQDFELLLPATRRQIEDRVTELDNRILNKFIQDFRLIKSGGSHRTRGFYQSILDISEQIKETLS